jgi:hypothetical protein
MWHFGGIAQGFRSVSHAAAVAVASLGHSPFPLFRHRRENESRCRIHELIGIWRPAGAKPVGSTRTIGTLAGKHDGRGGASPRPSCGSRSPTRIRPSRGRSGASRSEPPPSPNPFPHAGFARDSKKCAGEAGGRGKVRKGDATHSAPYRSVIPPPPARGGGVAFL